MLKKQGKEEKDEGRIQLKKQAEEINLAIMKKISNEVVFILTLA